MKENLLLLVSLLLGITIGAFDLAPMWLHNASLPMIILSLLVLQVGMGVGSMDNLGRMIRSIHWQMFLLPAWNNS
jgi:Membrane protein of unknown function (DUF340).